MSSKKKRKPDANASNNKSIGYGLTKQTQEEFKRTVAKMWAEMEAGMVTVCFPECETDSCLLWVKDRILLLKRAPDAKDPTFEFKPENYVAPTKAHVERLMKAR